MGLLTSIRYKFATTIPCIPIYAAPPTPHIEGVSLSVSVYVSMLHSFLS